jgi:hypothetical protein
MPKSTSWKSAKCDKNTMRMLFHKKQSKHWRFKNSKIIVHLKRITKRVSTQLIKLKDFKNKKKKRKKKWMRNSRKS